MNKGKPQLLCACTEKEDSGVERTVQARQDDLLPGSILASRIGKTKL
jgi:hypothetical protein